MANIEEGMARIETVVQCFTSNNDQGVPPGMVVDVPEAEADILVERGDALKAGNKKLGPVSDPDNAVVEGADADPSAEA